MTKGSENPCLLTICLNTAMRLVHMWLRGKYNIGVLFFICLTVSLPLPVSAAYSNGRHENLRLNRLAPLLLQRQLGFSGGYIDCPSLKKSDKAAHPRFVKVHRVRRMIPEEDWITKIMLLKNAATFSEYDFMLYSRCSGVILPVPAGPQDFLLTFSRRSPPSV